MEKHRVRPLYKELASTIQAMRNCEETKNAEWMHKHAEKIDRLVELLPHGSGIDSGCEIDLDKSHAEKLVIHTSYHHMNDAGYYDGWTEHTITVTPSFSGINMRISGANRNDIKDYLYETFDYALCADVAYDIYLPDCPEYAVKHSWEFSCPFCKTEWTNPDTRHTCDSFPGDKSNANRYQAKDEKQVLTVNGLRFSSWKEAQSYAADLMEGARV